MDSDVSMQRGSTNTARFRVDRPPPRPTFNRSVASQDGTVVGQRGQDGRFRTVATRNVPPGQVVSGTRPEPQQAPRTPARTAWERLGRGGLDL